MKASSPIGRPECGGPCHGMFVQKATHVTVDPPQPRAQQWGRTARHLLGTQSMPMPAQHSTGRYPG
jgi:hypothetical protein